MVPAAQRPKIAAARPATAIMWLGVVKIAALGGLATTPEPAGEVARCHKLHEPGRRAVCGRGLGVGTFARGSIGGSHPRGAGSRATAGAQGRYQDRAEDWMSGDITTYLAGRW